VTASDFPSWFVRLSGWPVFLVIVACVFLLMLLLSIVFTKISHRSVLQNALLAVLAVAVLSGLLLAVVSIMTKA
jgi:hypothetical protein